MNGTFVIIVMVLWAVEGPQKASMFSNLSTGHLEPGDSVGRGGAVLCIVRCLQQPLCLLSFPSQGNLKCS